MAERCLVAPASTILDDEPAPDRGNGHCGEWHSPPPYSMRTCPIRKEQLNAFLAAMPPAIRKLVVALRNAIRQAAPEAEESFVCGHLWYHRPNAGGRFKGAVCQINIKRREVRLDFIHGIRLSDPYDLLDGDSVSTRFVPIETVADAEQSELSDLIREAAVLDSSEWA